MKPTIIFLVLTLVSIKTLFSQIDTIEIQEIVITDSIEFSNSVFKLNNITNEKTTGNLLLQIPGVNITKRSSFSIEPTINSFKYDQINTTINGGVNAASSCPNRMDPITTRIAPNDIKKIEVVRGPYEVKYGQIMGGFINLITNTKPNYEKFTVLGSVNVEYNTNGNGKISSGNIKTGNKIFDIDLNLSERQFDNYTSGDGTEISSSYETYGVSSAIGLNITNKQRVTANYIYSKANDVMHAGLPMDAKYDESNMLSINYDYLNISKKFSDFKFKIYGSTEDHLMTNEYRPNATAALANTPVSSENYGGRFEFSIKPITTSIVNFGLDFNKIAKDGTKEVTLYKNICSNPVTVFDPPIEKEFEVWQNSYSQDLGVFIDLEGSLSEKFKIKLGFRTDYIKSDILNPEKDFLVLYDNNVTPDDIINYNYFETATYTLPNNFKFELSAGKGSRNPSLLERYINHFTIGLDAYEYVGNPNLKSETNTQVNLTLTKRHKNYFVYVDVFLSQIDNYITAVEDTTIPRKFTACKEPKFSKRFVNINQAEQYGFNIGAKIYFLKYFNTNIDLTYIHAENKDINEPLPEIAPFTSLISIGYKKNKLNVNLENEYQAEQTRISELAGETESDAFTVFNISASYIFFKSFNFGVAVDNIFDTNYYRHLSRPYKNMDTTSMFYEPGRNFRIFAKYNF